MHLKRIMVYVFYFSEILCKQKSLMPLRYVGNHFLAHAVVFSLKSCCKFLLGNINSIFLLQVCIDVPRVYSAEKLQGVFPLEKSALRTHPFVVGYEV